MKTNILTYLFLVVQLNIYTQNISTNSKSGSFIPGDLIVQLSPGSKARNITNRISKKYDLNVFKHLSTTANIWQLKFNPEVVDQQYMLDWLYKQPEVLLAQNNYYLELRSTIPNDANFDQQWHHHNTGQTGGTEDADIDSDLAWDITTGGTTASGHDIVIALIESGNLDHQDLTENRWYNTNEIPDNGVDDDGNGYVDDYNGWNPVQGNDNYGTGGHGTNCLGMMGAKGNNELNVVGANWDVKLMVIGGYNINTDANAILAYQYPLDMRTLWNNSGGSQGAFVVATSSSWGIDGEDQNNHPVWCNFYTTLGEAGILNVGATTNANLNVDTAGDMPTGCDSPYMVGVGRTDHNDNSEGGYGVSTINFGAPGINVVTTSGTNGITTTTGTSFACPLTAGVIGLAYSIPCSDFMNTVIENPQGGADLVLEALMDGTDYKSQLANKFVTGGRLNSRNTLDILMSNVCDGDICLGPSNISVNDIGTNTAIVQFNPSSSAASTTFYFRKVGNPEWVIDSSAISPINLSDLEECSAYEFYLESVCDSGSINQSSLQSFSTSGCGNCLDLPYCTSYASDGIDEWIETFEIGDYSFNSGNNQGYGNFIGSLASIDLKEGQTYNITVVVAWDNVLYNEQSRIWIDLNQDGNFEDSELLFDQGESSQQDSIFGSLTIPSGTILGETRLRVQMAYDDGNSLLPGPCDQFMWGEVEDYCVNIEQDRICGMDISSTVSQPQCSGIDNGSITVSVLGGNDLFEFQWSDGLGYDSLVADLSPGEFQLTVLDSTMCDTVITYNLNYLPSGINVVSIVNEPQCLGIDNGSINLLVDGGNSNYTFEWENSYGNVTELTNLAPEVYVVKITDSLMCDTTISYNLEYLTFLSLSSELENNSCFGGNEGSITVFPQGGLDYSYDWGNSFGNFSSIENLPAGSYSVEITDINGCTISENFTITEPLGQYVDFDYSVNELKVNFQNNSSFGNYLWDFGDNTSSSSTNPYHLYDSSGTYTVCLQLSTPCDTNSLCKDIILEYQSSVDIKEKIINKINVFPNPATNSLYFEVKNTDAYMIKITDLRGKIIEQREVMNEVEEFQITTYYTSGIYIYTISNSSKETIQSDKIKVVK